MSDLFVHQNSHRFLTWNTQWNSPAFSQSLSSCSIFVASPALSRLVLTTFVENHFTWSLSRGSGVWMTIMGATSLSYSSASTRMLTWFSHWNPQRSQLSADALWLSRDADRKEIRKCVRQTYRQTDLHLTCEGARDTWVSWNCFFFNPPLILTILTLFLRAPVHLVLKEDKATDFSLSQSGFIRGQSSNQTFVNYQRKFLN